VLLFGIVQIPVMLAFATVLALLLDSAAVRFRRFFRLVYFLPYGIPGVIAAILWSFLYLPGLSPVVAALQHTGFGTVNFLGADSTLWSIANIVTWEYTGYNMLIIYAALQAIPPTCTRRRALTAPPNGGWPPGSSSRWWPARWC
jgi:multiple sugar transport system permease protein